MFRATPWRGHVGVIEAAAQEFVQALVGDAEELLQKLAVVAKVDP